MKLYQNKIDNQIYFVVEEFKHITNDWNNDNDIYTENVILLSEGYNHNQHFTKDDFENDFIEINTIKFYDKISNSYIALDSNEIKTIYKNNMYDTIRYGYEYELHNNDDIVFQFDEITE